MRTDAKQRPTTKVTKTTKVSFVAFVSLVVNWLAGLGTFAMKIGWRT